MSRRDKQDREQGRDKVHLDNQDLAKARIQARRREAISGVGDSSGFRVGESWRPFSDKGNIEEYVARDLRTGLALSGGGIRSATISLGLIEALAARGRFYGFDLLSTVSGGGYCGSFVRSLFIERGGTDKIVTARTDFADATLTSLPDQQFFRGEPGPSQFVAKGESIKNPLWWLRENGRYLAPGGMSDYGFALSYIVRNWITLLGYVLGVTMLAFAALQLVLIGLKKGMTFAEPLSARQVHEFLESSSLLSPLWPLLAAAAIVGAGIAAAYWVSTPMPYSRSATAGKVKMGRLKVGALVVLLDALLVAILWLDRNGSLPTDTVAQAWAYGLLLGLFSLLLSAAYTGAQLEASATHADFRREQTRLLATFNVLFLILLAATLIDWAALSLRRALDEERLLLSAGAFSTTLISITSFLVAKVPDWVGGDGSGLRKFLVGHARHGALVAAIIILVSVALLADLLVLKLVWRGTAWAPESPIEWHVFGAVTGLIGLVVLLLGRSLNFVNLLGLTPFYGSRLSRAYLGGSNAARLKTTDRSQVTEGQSGDDIELSDYMDGGGPAPLHLINVTRNRTIGDEIQSRIEVENDDPLVREESDDPRGRLPSYESSLTLHDRHGDRVVFGPFGVRVGAKFFPLGTLKEPPSLGLLCAISGAAVGSGMGRHTSLGTAMALTLANVRLGYWWTAQDRNPPAAAPPRTGRLRALGKRSWFFLIGKNAQRTAARQSRRRSLLPGLSCLYHELLGRFGTSCYWHLSDGGHSENSGALTLLERGCQFILVADNAQDPEYKFGDLEIFIRTARTDIGMEVAVADEHSFPPSLRAMKHHFFNGSGGDWREKARSEKDAAFALLLKAKDIPYRENGVWKSRRPGKTWIVWLKPNRLADLPDDLATYAELNPDYPQQSTSNQFFDEAQWESYRRLGFEMGRRLFARSETLADYLPIIRRRETSPASAM